MKFVVAQDECISCAVCSGECPEVSEEDEVEGVARIVAAYRFNADPTGG